MKTLRNALVVALGLTGTASANSFNINEHDARVTGRGGATAASNDDPSSIVFNPGGVALSDGTTVILGTSLYIAQGSYENATTPKVTTDSAPAPVPNLYVTSRVHDMVSVGLGVHFPFGLSISYPENHPQTTVAQDQNLKTMFITPVIGFNLHKQVPGLSIGGGPDIVAASVELKRGLQFGSERGTVDLAASKVGFGFRAGVEYHPPAAKGLKLGVMYRSQVALNFEGDGDFDIADPFRAQLPPDGAVTTKITLPMSVAGGIAYSPVKNFEVEFNAVWINWSKAFPKDPSRTGRLDGKSGDPTSLQIVLPDGSISSVAEDYEDTITYRIGFDYHLPKQKLNLRAGFIYDPTPIPTATLTAQLPDVDRINVTVGASHQLTSTLGAHFSLLWVTPRERDTSTDPAVPFFKGTYGVQALVISLGLSGQFGAKKATPDHGTAKVAKND